MATKTVTLMRRLMRIMTMTMKTAMMNGMKNMRTMMSTTTMKTMTMKTMTMKMTEEAEMAVAVTDSATIRVDSPPEAHAAVPQVVVVREAVHPAAAPEAEDVAVPVTVAVPGKVIRSLVTNTPQVEVVPDPEVVLPAEAHEAVLQAAQEAVPQAAVAVEVLPVDREEVHPAVHVVLRVADEAATADKETARADLRRIAEVPAEEAASAAVADVILN